MMRVETQSRLLSHLRFFLKFQVFNSLAVVFFYLLFLNGTLSLAREAEPLLTKKKNNLLTLLMSRHHYYSISECIKCSNEAHCSVSAGRSNCHFTDHLVFLSSLNHPPPPKKKPKVSVLTARNPRREKTATFSHVYNRARPMFNISAP